MEEMKNLNLRITIKAICYYEKLTKKSFVNFDKDSSNTILKFLYALIISHPENGIRYTYDFTEKTLFSNIDIMNYLKDELDKEMSFINQFDNLFETIDKQKRIKYNLSNKQETKENNSDKIYIYQLVPYLVKDCGLDINYVLNEMPYTDIELYMDHANNVHQVKLEEDRLWTYFNMLPHVNSKKARFKGPEDLIKFEWEEDKNKITSENKLNKDAEYLKSIGFKASNIAH